MLLSAGRGPNEEDKASKVQDSLIEGADKITKVADKAGKRGSRSK